MPPSRTTPLREPASNRSCEWLSFCHGEASSARTSADNAKMNKAASAARGGTIIVMKRLYSLPSRQTIELLVTIRIQA
jgi:sulfatase maturation enzyme AslB (radical SAM superfamily)